MDDLNEFARVNGTNYKTLKLLNPWLRDNVLKVQKEHRGKTYTVLLPDEGFDKAMADDEQ